MNDDDMFEHSGPGKRAKTRSRFRLAWDSLYEAGPLRIAAVVAIAAMVVSAVGLYQFKHEAQERQSHIAQLRVDIAKERAAIDLLQAEWTYLNRPERIQALSERFLNLEPFTMDQMIAVEDIAIREDPAPADIADLLKALQ